MYIPRNFFCITSVFLHMVFGLNSFRVEFRTGVVSDALLQCGNAVQNIIILIIIWWYIVYLACNIFSEFTLYSIVFKCVMCCLNRFCLSVNCMKMFGIILHTHTRLTALFKGLPRWAGTRKVKPIWILLKQEAVSGSGISWAICKSAPRCRQTTTPAPRHSFFTGRMPFLPPNQQRQSTEGILGSY